MAIFHAILNIVGVNSHNLYKLSPGDNKFARYNFFQQLGVWLCKPFATSRLGNKKFLIDLEPQPLESSKYRFQMYPDLF